MSCAATASTGTPANVPRSPFARTVPSGKFSCALAVTTTGAPGLRSRSMASGSRWCDGSSVTRIRSAGFARDRSPAIQGSTCTTVPECSTCTLACKMGVMTMSPPSAGTLFEDCADRETAPIRSAAQTTVRAECRLAIPPCYGGSYTASTAFTVTFTHSMYTCTMAPGDHELESSRHGRYLGRLSHEGCAGDSKKTLGKRQPQTRCPGCGTALRDLSERVRSTRVSRRVDDVSVRPHRIP